LRLPGAPKGVAVSVTRSPVKFEGAAICVLPKVAVELAITGVSVIPKVGVRLGIGVNVPVGMRVGEGEGTIVIVAVGSVCSVGG
jgi:hypothetical protein